MPAKRIILMYISEVSGHRSAAEALEKALKISAPETEILSINAFGYTNPISEKIINRLYMGVIQKTPKIWDYLYDNPRIVKKIEWIKNKVHKVNLPKLKNLFDKFNPDIVACTQAFPCGMVADFKRTYNSKIKLVAVLTDFIPHAYWVYDTIDYYISPSEEVTSRLAAKGVLPEKIKTLGIPFDPKFNQEVKKDEVIQKLNLSPGLPVILIMGGGHGLGPIKGIARSLEKVNLEFQEIIVAGINERLYNSLKKEAGRYRKKMLLLGYVDNIHELMSVADIIITKPGGVTTAEALAKKVPMIIVKPIPGQEANNTAYLIEKQAAVKIDEPTHINLTIASLLNDPLRLEKMRLAASGISKPNASLDIANLLLSL